MRARARSARPPPRTASPFPNQDLRAQGWSTAGNLGVLVRLARLVEAANSLENPAPHSKVGGVDPRTTCLSTVVVHAIPDGFSSRWIRRKYHRAARGSGVGLRHDRFEK